MRIDRPWGIAAALSLILLALAAAPATAQNLAGYTNMSRSPGHGTQIEYVAEGGTAYLWYPGNRRILPGRWKLEDGNMCFAYGPNTYNPVTGSRGGWECEPVSAYRATIVERMRGDVLGLVGRGAVPFRLDPGPTTLERMLVRVSPGATPSPEPQSAAPSNQPALTCQSIIANAERSRSDMSLASGTYFHGTFMGKPCVAVDYARAFELAEQAGDSVEPYLDVLRARAESGNPRAIRALELLDR